MSRFNCFAQQAALCALLSCFSLHASADDIQDANKLFKRGQTSQALNKVDALLANQPKDAQARFLKAVILKEQGQTEESMRMFTLLTEDYPELPEPYNNLAVLYAEQGQFEKAKVVLEKALRTHPSYSTAHENLGDIYAKMASQAYDKALQLDRNKTSSATKLVMLKDMVLPLAKAGKTQLASVTPPPAITTPVAVATAPAASANTAVIHSPAPIKTEPSPAPTPAITTGQHEEVLKAVNEWTRAWSAKNVNKYLAMYAQDFTPPNNETRNEWAQQRRERIAKPQPISIVLSNTKVKLVDDTHAAVSFIQSYKAGSLKSTTHKTLEMSKASGTWLIQSEKAGSKK